MEQFIQYANLYQEVERDVIRAALRKHIKEQLAQGISQTAEGKEVIARLGTDLFAKKAPTLAPVFITIGAKDGVDPVQFVKTMKNVLKKKGLEQDGESMYVLEQRSESAEQAPYGWHIHWLVTFKEHLPKSQRIKLIYEGFKQYMVAKNYVQIDPVKNTPADIERVKKYMSGGKADVKLAKVSRDRELRQSLSIPDFFVTP